MAGLVTPIEILQCATGVAAEVLNQSGELGVVEKGAAADLLVIAGDPISDLPSLQAPEKSPLAVMKAGRFYKYAPTSPWQTAIPARRWSGEWSSRSSSSPTAAIRAH